MPYVIRCKTDGLYWTGRKKVQRQDLNKAKTYKLRGVAMSAIRRAIEDYEIVEVHEGGGLVEELQGDIS